MATMVGRGLEFEPVDGVLDLQGIGGKVTLGGGEAGMPELLFDIG